MGETQDESMSCVKQWIATLGILIALAVAWPAFGQVQYETERRLGYLEGLRTDARLSILETEVAGIKQQLDSIDVLVKGMFAAVLAQLLAQIINWRRPRQ